MAEHIVGRHLAQIPNPAGSVVLLESSNPWPGAGPDVLWCIGSTAGRLGKKSFEMEPLVIYEAPNFYHNEAANYPFADTHAKALKGPNPRFPGYRVDSDGIAVSRIEDPLPN